MNFDNVSKPPAIPVQQPDKHNVAAPIHKGEEQVSSFITEDEATRVEMAAFVDEEDELAAESLSPAYKPQQHQSHSQPMQSYDSAPQEPIRHTKEKTLLLDSPLLHAIEEAAGERKVVRRNWPIVVVIILICVIVCLAFFKTRYFLRVQNSSRCGRGTRRDYTRNPSHAYCAPIRRHTTQASQL